MMSRVGGGSSGLWIPIVNRLEIPSLPRIFPVYLVLFGNCRGKQSTVVVNPATFLTGRRAMGQSQLIMLDFVALLDLTEEA